jgi:hypothetical protein
MKACQEITYRPREVVSAEEAFIFAFAASTA